jgi:hypothetical protein
MVKIMSHPSPVQPADALPLFLRVVGQKRWASRMAEIRRGCVPGHAGRALARHHAIELTIDRLLRLGKPPAPGAETLLAQLAIDLATLAGTLLPHGQARLKAQLDHALTGAETLVPLFHLVRCARIQQDRGFTVAFTGLEDDTSFDLLLERDGRELEVICDTISAEEGRDVHRNAWSYLVDSVDPDLQSWLATHPGRYLLKMTLPQGLKYEGLRQEMAQGGNAALAALQSRISRLLSESRRADHDEAAVMRLEPLLLAGAQATELGLMRDLRKEFGHEAHLAVTAAGRGVFVMAARAAREDEVAEAMHRRMVQIAFIEDTDQIEWRVLRDQLRLEGAARQFLTRAEARSVVAVTCISRLEMLGGIPPNAAEGGELRFRSPGHADARTPAFAPAIAAHT